MSDPDHDDDIRAIEALIARQFASVNWAPDHGADWEVFAADFLEDAPLYPAARPAGRQSVAAFIERMDDLRQGGLGRFDETLLGTEIRVFGDVALATAGCEIVENGTDVSRGVEMLLLIKDGGAWRIAAQAWDGETEAVPLPSDLAGGKPGR